MNTNMPVNIEQLEAKARFIRRETFEMVLRAGCGHLGGSFSCVETLIALYHGRILRVNPRDPAWPERDRFILSKGHANNSLYVILADLGFFPMSDLNQFCVSGYLGNHADNRVPGVEIISGSLGHGLGIASGIALGAKLSGHGYHTFVLLGDGESQEGSVWEAAMFAAQHKLSNLTAILDRNRLGSEDFTEDTAGLDPVEDKWRAFGWEVVSIDGHCLETVYHALAASRGGTGRKPLMIVTNTIKGKGISALENHPKAHHTLPKGAEVEQTRLELV